MDSPCSATTSDEPRQAAQEAALQKRMQHVARKILVMSGKGGVGKSTVATHLALALQRAGRRVGVLDVDLHGPSVPRMLGLADRRPSRAADGSIEPVETDDGLKVLSVGMMLEHHSDAVVWRGPMKYNVIRQFLADAAWGELDDLVIDAPPGTGDEPLTVAQLLGPGTSAVVVTTPQQVAVDDVRRSLSFCRMLSLEVLGVVENMSGLVCPHCRETVDVFRRGGGETLAADMGVGFLGRVPLDPQMVLAGDDGQANDPAESPAAQALANVAERIIPREDAIATPEPNRKDFDFMTIAIPTAGGQLCPHFGHCEQFAFVTLDEAGKAIAAIDYRTPPPHEPGVLPAWLAEQGAEIIIAGGMGQRAQMLFAQNGISVLVGAPASSPETLVQAWLAETLETGQNLCDH